MKDLHEDIQSSVETHDVECIHRVLDEYDVDCSTRDGGKILDVPGFGSIFYERPQTQGTDGGYVVRHDYDMPVESGELAVELTDLVKSVQKIK